MRPVQTIISLTVPKMLLTKQDPEMLAQYIVRINI